MTRGRTMEASRVPVTFYLLIWMAVTQVGSLWKFLFCALCTFLYVPYFKKHVYETSESLELCAPICMLIGKGQ